MSSAHDAAPATGQTTDPNLPADHGALPRWDVAELPAPPPFGLRNLMAVIGPGAIMAATSIGGGEWLVGPAAAVKYSSSIFLIATVAIGLQVIFNLEAIRYTLYTGEPIYGGIMRLKPGPKFWAVFYSILGFFQLGWPALAGSAAATLFGAWMGRMPGAPDQATQAWIATALILAVVLILSFGGTIERMLEYFAWTMLAVVFLFLIAINLAFVPLSHWWQTFTGFFSFSGLPRPIDWGLIGALAATAGSGGLGNLTVTNWIRDKGFGMGSKVGAIPSAVGGHAITLSHVGTVFPTTDENLARWREWMRYVHVDQIWVWGLFCFVGMFLNVNLATAIIPHGTDLQGLAAGAYQAEYLSKIWPGFWFLTLFNGFWILFKTQLGNTDILVRTVTDALWMSSQKARDWRRGIRAIYYGILVVFSVWGVVVIRSASPFQLFKILANMAGIVLLIAGVQIFLVNRRFLPKAVRPPLWREIGLLACSALLRVLRVLRRARSPAIAAGIVRHARPDVARCAAARPRRSRGRWAARHRQPPSATSPTPACSSLSMGRHFLIDAPIRDGIAPYPTSPPDERRAARVGASRPTTASTRSSSRTGTRTTSARRPIAAHLSANQRATVISSPEVIDRIRRVAPLAASLAASRVSARPRPGRH